MNREQKLERWAEREITRNINHIILENDDGGILAFGKYDITPSGQHVTVSLGQDVLARLHDRRTALSWCVAHRKHLVGFGIHIAAIDERYQMLRNDLDLMQRRYRRCRDSQRRELLRAKLQQLEYRVRMLQDELTKCAVKAKYLQLRGFEK